MSRSALWIDWGSHLRTHSMCRRLGLPLFEIREPGGRVARYWKSTRRTLEILRRERPKVVVASNPSLLLGFLLLLLRRRYGFRLVSDAHYVGVEALRGGGLVQWLLDRHNRAADLVIVTNEGHRRHVVALGGRAFICPDPLPDLRAEGETLQLGERSAFLICSFDADEPFAEAFEAFRQLADEGYELYVSGNPSNAGVRPESFPWVRFLGFVPKAEYEAHLRSAALVLDLTRLENCLVCGAYEALRLARPLLLSDTRALQGYFGQACAYTPNQAPAIAVAVREAHAERAALAERARRWTEENEVEMQKTLQQLGEAIRHLAE